MYLHTAKSGSEGRHSKGGENAGVIFVAAVFLIICLFVSGQAEAQAERLHRVLVLQSYHPTYEWTKSIMNGIESTLKQYKDIIEMDVEYMDCKHFNDEKHFENLYALYKDKASRRQYEVILTGDNDALLFLLRHRNELCPNIPVVFCGINDFSESMLKDCEGVTGVTEEYLFEDTVETALALHPSLKKVVLAVGGWPTNPDVPRDTEKVIQRFSRRAKFVKVFLGDYPSEEAYIKKVKELWNESIVFFTLPIRDPLGNRFSFEGVSALLRGNDNVPIYVISEQWFGYAPVVGGKLNNGFYQGQAAAQMAIRILDGEDPKNIPIQHGSADKYTFDYTQLRRFGIKLSSLPKGSIIINEPKSFYYLYKKQIWIVTAIIISLAAAVMVLFINILRRKQAEKKLLEYQAQLKSLASELSLTEERERHQISTGLHDRISQALVISKLRLKSLRRKDFPDGLNKSLDETCELLDQIIQNIRSLTFDLSSPILYELGFEAAVAEWLDEQVRKKHGIETEFVDDGQPKPLNNDIRVLLFRNVQELLTNVIRHSHAHKVKVSSRKIDGQICVCVEDDGTGFSPAATAPQTTARGGFGLFGIQQRLEQLSGRLEIVSKPGHGTKITIMAPLKQEKADPAKIKSI